MDEKDFRLLLTLEKTRSITRAADQLYVAQSALSKRLKGIEEELGVMLLVRAHNGIRFTPEGEIVLENVRRAAESMEQMRYDLQMHSGAVSGTINAGISISYAEFHLADVVSVYRRRYPNVKLQISTDKSGTLHRKMQEGKLDLAVIRGQFPWDGVCKNLKEERIYLISKEECSLEELIHQPYIERKTEDALQSDIRRWLSEQGQGTPETGFSVDSIATCVEMVNRGLGWGIVPEIGLRNFHGHACLCELDGRPMIRTTSLLCRPEIYSLPQISAFAQLLREQAKG